MMYSASAKGCTQPGCRVQTRVHSPATTTISRQFPETPCFPALPEFDPRNSCHLKVATMPYPRSGRRGQDGCPSSAHPYPSPTRVGHPFFSKECSVLCVLFRSFKKNVPFFPFFSVLLKRMFHSLHSFPFF